MLSDSLRAYHDAVYVTTIKSNVGRQERLLSEFGEGTVEFIYGLDQHEVTKEQLIRDGLYDEERARQIDPHGRAMSLSHICCAYTHREVYKLIVERRQERALIFEDDATMLAAGEEEIERAVANVPNDAGVILWGWFGGRLQTRTRGLQQALNHTKRLFRLSRHNHRMIRNAYLRSYNAHFYVGASTYGLHAYTVTLSAAEKLIELNTPIVFNSDHVTNYGARNEAFRLYASRKQFFGNRSLDPEDPTVSLIHALS